MVSLCQALLSLPGKLYRGLFGIKRALRKKLESWRYRCCPGANNQHQLTPGLWGALPTDIADRIIEKILVDLPFSRLLSFCCICRKWKDFLLSNEYLFYFQMGQCHLFNPRRNLWESVSMEFAQLGDLSVQHLKDTSCSGGLLMFDDNYVDAQVIICNPLTKRLRKFYAQCSTAQRTIHRFVRPSLKVRATWQCSSQASTSITGHPLWLSLTDLETEIQICMTFPVWYFVLSMSQNQRRGRTLVLDNRSDTGWDMSDFPQDFCFFVNRPIMLKNSIIALGFGTYANRFTVLLYDLDFMGWTWVSTTRHVNAVIAAMESVDKVMIVTTDGLENHWQVFEIEDKKLFTRKEVEPPLQASSERVWPQMVLGVPDHLLGEFLDCYTSSTFSLFCVGQEDIASVYYVGVRGKLISVLRYNKCGDSSEFTLNWDYRSDFPSWLPELSDFHIFKPSLSQV